MNLYAVQKEALRMTIDANPTLVTVNRTSYIEHEGGRKKVESVVGPFKILIYPKSGNRSNRKETTGDPGSKDSEDWVGLALDDADFRAGAHVTEYFDTPNLGRFSVKSSTPITIEGKVTGYLLALERIGYG